MSVKKTKKRKKKTIKTKITVWLLTGMFLLLFYIMFCVFVGDRKFYSNTKINGIEVSSMTADEAAVKVKKQFDEMYKDASVTVLLKEKEYSINISKALNLNVTDALTDSIRESHRFFARGYRYVKALFVASEYVAVPSVSDRKEITKAINESGINDAANEGNTSYRLEKDSIIVVKGKGGYEVDAANLTALLERMILNGDISTKINCPIKYSEVDLESIYNDIYREPQNPTLDAENNYTVLEAVEGISFDKKEAEKILEAAEDGEELYIPIIRTKPDMSTQEYKEALFRDALGSFSTAVGGSDYRRTNVRLAAEYCNDKILLPGEAFSFNNVVGQRTEERGFKPAPSYVNGESVDEVGGGICQVSSTLYNACLYSNLQIDERHCHPHESAYVAAGFDATVSWGGPDYVFSNDTEFPIKICTAYDGSNVYCVIYGTRQEDFYVELTSETTSVEEYKTEYEDDDTMEEGEEEVSVNGINGFTVVTYRKVYDSDGNLVSEAKESTSTYSRQDKIVKVGTKKKKKKKKEENKKEEATEKNTAEESSEKNTNEEVTEKDTEKQED